VSFHRHPWDGKGVWLLLWGGLVSLVRGGGEGATQPQAMLLAQAAIHDPCVKGWRMRKGYLVRLNRPFVPALPTHNLWLSKSSPVGLFGVCFVSIELFG
jgi:hypothetical protein